MDIITLLLTLLVVGIVVYFAFWMVDSSGAPAPINWIIKTIILVFGILLLFGGYTGHLPAIVL